MQLIAALWSVGRDALFSSMARAALDVPNVTAAVATALARPSHCVPVGGVMLSMANPHHQPLRNYQFSKIRHVRCLMDRLVSVCYGDWKDDYGTCVYQPCKTLNTSRGMVQSKDSACVASDYRRSQYVSLNWAKWPFFIDALRVARVMLWIEADVVINRNPWEGLAGVPGVDAPWLVRRNTLGRLDVTYQWEAPPCNREAGWPRSDSASWVKDPGVSCLRTMPAHAEPLNCGQLLITSLPFAQAVWDARPAKFVNGELSQQHYANDVKKRFKHDGLPMEFFNNCWQKESTWRIPDLCKLVTFHATCSATSSVKGRLMSSYLDKFLDCPLNNRTGRLLFHNRTHGGPRSAASKLE